MVKTSGRSSEALRVNVRRQVHSPIWLSLDDFLLLHACSSKSRPRFLIVFRHTSNDAFCKWTIETNIIGEVNWLLAKRDQGIFCGSGVAFGQCANNPKVNRGKICGPNCIDGLMQWSGIGFPIQVN